MFLFVSAMTLLFACEKETEGLSKSAYYVSFKLKGDNPAVVQVGMPYTDAGVIATENGKDVTASITTKSNVVHEEMGMYKVEYSAVNSDGLASKAVRDVIVCNPSVTTNLEGTYVGQEGSHRLVLSTGAVVDYPGYHCKITYLAPGFFYINDFFSGWYAERVYPQYGYAIMGMTGYFALNDDNSISLISSYIDAWGDGLDKLENGKYDPETGEISWDAYYAGSMKFHVVINK
jgi:hypothetical protein